MYYDQPTQDSDQIDLTISPYGKFYITFAPLHPEDDPQVIVRTERERLKSFYSLNARPQIRSVVSEENYKDIWVQKKSLWKIQLRLLVAPILHLSEQVNTSHHYGCRHPLHKYK